MRDMDKVSDLDLMTEWLKRRRAAQARLLTRGNITEVRHVCYYTAQHLMGLRDEVVRPGFTPDLVEVEVREAIASLEALIKYVQTGQGGTSHLHDRNE